MDERIAYCVLFTNGMVMTIGAHGDQLPDLQGRYGEVVDAILDRKSDVRFLLAQWTGEGPLPWIELATFQPVRIGGEQADAG